MQALIDMYNENKFNLIEITTDNGDTRVVFGFENNPFGAERNKIELINDPISPYLQLELGKYLSIIFLKNVVRAEGVKADEELARNYIK